MRDAGWKFRRATLYSPDHNKDEVIYIVDAAGKTPWHIRKAEGDLK